MSYKISATRLEPETGRLQYLVAGVDFPETWFYADDKKFIAEFGALVKAFFRVETKLHRGRIKPVQRYRPDSEANKPQHKQTLRKFQGVHKPTTTQSIITKKATKSVVSSALLKTSVRSEKSFPIHSHFWETERNEHSFYPQQPLFNNNARGQLFLNAPVLNCQSKTKLPYTSLFSTRAILGETISTASSSSNDMNSSRRPGNQKGNSSSSNSSSHIGFTQLVLRHRPGWTQIWMFATSRMQNSFNPDVCEELRMAVECCVNDPDTALILISSSGPVFCSGIDLHYLIQAKNLETAAQQLSDSLFELCQAILSCPKPIFVAVNGPCVGFGLALCCMADVAMATEKAVFSTSYASLGHCPDGGLSLTLPSVIGKAMANEVLMMERRLTAVEALRAGLISRVMWPSNFASELIVRLDSIASGPKVGLKAIKMMMQSAPPSFDEYQPSLDTVDSMTKLSLPSAILRAVKAECEMAKSLWVLPESMNAMKRYAENF